MSRAPTQRTEIGILCALAGLLVLHGIYLGVVAEDAYISFRFARHLARGQGLVWNVGEGPVEGYTNFLWVVLCSLPVRAGIDLPFCAQIGGIVAGLATLFTTHRFARRLLDVPRGRALLPCLMLAVAGPFATWAASGMETGLFTLFVLLGVYHMGSWARFQSPRAPLAAFSSLFLATLTRPEGFLVFGLMVFFGGSLCVRVPARVARSFLVGIVAYVVPCGVYLLWRYEYFGYLLPITYHAKTGGTYYQYLRGAKYVAGFLIHFVLPLTPVLFTLFLEHGRIGRSSAARARLGAWYGSPVWACALVCGVYLAYVTYVGGDYMAMYRFLVPILPLVYLLFGWACDRLLSAVPGPGRRRVVTVGLAASAVGLTLLQSTPLESSVFYKPWWMHGTYSGVQHERWHVARLRLLGELFRDRKRSDQDSLAVSPIGVISWVTDMPIHSIAAIVDPELALRKRGEGREIGRGFPGHEKESMGHALSKRPTFVMFSRYFEDEPRGYPDYPEAELRVMREHYEPVSVPLNDEVNGDSGYFTFLQRKGIER